MADLPQDETKEVVLIDGAGVNEATVTATGAVKVDGSAVTQPISGNIVVSNFSPSTVTTYSAAITAFVAAATATDIFTITGSATKTVNVLRIYVTATSSLGTMTGLTLLKRSTANSGGTSTVVTNVAMDSNNAVGTAIVRAYTVNPTTGTLVGNLRSIKLPSSTVSPTTPNLITFVEDFDLRGQPVVLRGTSEVFAVNLGSATLTGNSFAIAIEWIEI